MNKKSNVLIYSLIFLVVIASVLVFFGNKQGWFKKQGLTEVEVAEVVKGTIIEKVSASGKIQPETEVKISADVSGEVIGLYVKEGDSVRQGQVLLKIRPDNYQSLYERAQAGVNSSKAGLEQSKSVAAQAETRLMRTKIEYERNLPLYKQKVISDADFQQIKTNYEISKAEVESALANIEAAQYSIKNAEASLKDAAENLRKTTIYAPVSGTISKLNIEQGERVVGTMQMTGTEILRIANLNLMEVVVDVNENDIVRISLGDSAEIDVDAFANMKRKFKGHITSIANTAKSAVSSEAVTTFEVKVRIDNRSYADLQVNPSQSPFRPGMTASLDIFTDRKDDIFIVPLSAVTIRAEKEKEDGPEKTGLETEEEQRRAEKAELKKEIVFVLEGKKAKKRFVSTGISDFDNIQIVSGLKSSEKVITGPYLAVSKTLKDGDEVELKKEDKKKKVEITF